MVSVSLNERKGNIRLPQWQDMAMLFEQISLQNAFLIELHCDGRASLGQSFKLSSPGEWGLKWIRSPHPQQGDGFNNVDTGVPR